MDPGALRNFKDFLQLYNRMTEMCFARCVDNVNSRYLEPNEIDCVDDCSMKFIKFNNKLMHNFVIAQQEIVNKRVSEMESIQGNNTAINQPEIDKTLPELSSQSNQNDVLLVEPSYELSR